MSYWAVEALNHVDPGVKCEEQWETPLRESGLHDARREAGPDRLRGLHEATKIPTMQITGGGVIQWCHGMIGMWMIFEPFWATNTKTTSNHQRTAPTHVKGTSRLGHGHIFDQLVVTISHRSFPWSDQAHRGTALQHCAFANRHVLSFFFVSLLAISPNDTY